MRDNRQLLSIGEASKITGVHVKSLRYYDRIGVFCPEYVDKRSGYRYYSFDQLQKILAVRTCLDTGIVLSDLYRYQEEGCIDYQKLINDARSNLNRQIEILDRRKTYLEFLKDEVDFNDNCGGPAEDEKCYGSMALWTMPLEDGMESFSRKETILKVAASAKQEGYQINPLYFGVLMKVNGKKKQLFAIAGLEDFLNVGEDENEHIYHTPNAWYKRVVRPDLDIEEAEHIFPELFSIDYEKTVLTTISLRSSSEELMYSMFINLPDNPVINDTMPVTVQHSAGE